MLTEKEKQELILKNYEYGNFDELSKLIGKSKNTITEWARKRGLKRKVSSVRQGNLAKFLDGSLESFYWLGFHAADGYISKHGHFMLSQSKREHLELLAKFLETKVKVIKHTNSYSKSNISYRVTIYDSEVGKYINQMLGVITQKTYDEIKLDFLNTLNKTKAFLIGYIDGDGSIKQSSIKLQCHKNWYPVYQKIYNLLTDTYHTDLRLLLEYKKSHQDSYSTMYIKAQYSRILYKFAIDNQLPINIEKWEKLSS